MKRKVDKIEFWDKRIESVRDITQLFQSIYLTTQEDWDAISAEHAKTIKKLIKSDEQVLDAGCAYGRLAELFDKGYYTGIDFVPKFILLATKLHPGYRFFIGDLKKMPFKDKEFDWVICCSIKHMINNYVSEKDEWDNMEKELKRVANKILILEYLYPLTYQIL